MNANPKSKSVTGNASLVRPCFSPGLLLRDDDLRQGVDYTRDLSRLLFRSLFGCGVVCGLNVVPTFKCGKLVVTVQPGVALDCCGDPIQVQEPAQICIDASCDEKLPGQLCVAVRRTEKCCAPRSAICSDDDDEATAVCTRERDGYEIRIAAECPSCACQCKSAGETASTAPEAPPSNVKMSAKSIKEKKSASQKAAEILTDVSGQDNAPNEACWCANPISDCYKAHYQGICGCDCSGCPKGCDCGWVVLALVLDQSTEKHVIWTADHSVRRFVRPVLMRDPVAWNESRSQQQPQPSV